VQAQQWEYKHIMTASFATLSRRVLVVDDHEDCRELLAALVSDSGCTVRAASTGVEAVAVAGQFLPDVVLLDIGLPDMSGYEVATAIRANPATADAFIAAVTGYGMNSDVKQATRVGVDLLLVKPVGWKDLHVALCGMRNRESA
jgi:two-component system, sensor histidine kinase